jgi:hypothetical protein
LAKTNLNMILKKKRGRLVMSHEMRVWQSHENFGA